MDMLFQALQLKKQLAERAVTVPVSVPALDTLTPSRP
jgi:hypothetical protein